VLILAALVAVLYIRAWDFYESLIHPITLYQRFLRPESARCWTHALPARSRDRSHHRHHLLIGIVKEEKRHHDRRFDWRPKGLRRLTATEAIYRSFAPAIRPIMMTLAGSSGIPLGFRFWYRIGTPGVRWE